MSGKTNNTSFGKKAEEIAVKLLRKKGYRILCRNYTCKLGEIDIVAKHKDVLVFVEVKARRSLKFGFPEEAVTNAKLKKIKKASECFVKTHSNLPDKKRIDVVAMLFSGDVLVSAKLIQVV